MNRSINATNLIAWLKDPENLPLLIVLAVIVLVILVLVVVMIVRTVRQRKRSDRETEEAVRALANVPPDEEYLPYSPENELRSPKTEEEPVAEEPVAEEPSEAEETPSEEAEEPEETEAEEEETFKEEQEEQAVEEDPVAEETEEETAPAAEEEKEEPEMAEKKPAAPAKKAEPAKKDVKKPVKKAEPKAPAKKAEAPKVSSANGKWVIEEVKGEFWLSLMAPNGQVMLESPTAYASLSSARSGIKTYQENIAAGRLKITEHKNGDMQVQVLNGRGSLLAPSSTYSTRAQAESALASIKRWAPTTAVEEITAK